MGRTACTEPQCLYKGDLYLYLYLHLSCHLLDTKYESSCLSCGHQWQADDAVFRCLSEEQRNVSCWPRVLILVSWYVTSYVTSSSELRQFQATWSLLDRVS